MTKATKQPVKKISLGSIRASIWENTTNEGETFHTVSFERSYKDKAGKWHNMSSYGAKDLLNLIRVAAQAEAFIQFPKVETDEKEAA